MSQETFVQPKLADLLAGYLNRQAEAQTRGLAAANLEGEVLPYDSGPVQTVDPKQAWDETVVVARCFAPNVKAADLQIPPSWAGLVAGHEPVVALACAFGNFPQMVRQFHTILQCRNLGMLRPSSVTPASAPGTAEWARQTVGKSLESGDYPQLLAALGILRLAKEFAEADKVFQAHDRQIPASWRTAWGNERAALSWHRGQTDEACDLWRQLEPTAVILFNRGMAELFLDRPMEAQASLKPAVARFPEEGAWHHLGRLYLTLAQSRES